MGIVYTIFTDNQIGHKLGLSIVTLVCIVFYNENNTYSVHNEHSYIAESWIS